MFALKIVLLAFTSNLKYKLKYKSSISYVLEKFGGILIYSYLLSYVAITTQLSGFADHRIKHSSRRSVFIHPNHMAEPAEPLDINTIINVHVIEELIQLPVGSDTVVIALSGPKAAASVLDSVHASTP